MTRWYERLPAPRKSGAGTAKDLFAALLYLSSAVLLAFGLVKHAAEMKPPVRSVFPATAKATARQVPAQISSPLTEQGVKR